MLFTITVSEKDGQQSTYSFDKSEISIGRVKGNDIVLPKGNVSKRHSRIVVKDDKFIVVDLKSTNGTYVNGRKITSPQVIKADDKVYVGDFVLSISEGNQAGLNGPAANPAPGLSGPTGATMQPTPSPAPPPPSPPPMGGGGGLGSGPSLSRLGGTPEPPPPSPPPDLRSSRPMTPPPPGPPPGPSGPPSPGMPAPRGMSSPPPPREPAMTNPSPPPPRGGGMNMPAPASSPPPPAAGGGFYAPAPSAIPPRPQFSSRYDENFANMQAQAAEQVFGSIDLTRLPTHYPPTEQDRHQFDQTVRDIANRVGGGNPLADHLLSELIGLGPLEALLDNQAVDEIYVNAHNQVLYRERGQVVAAERGFSHPEFLFLAAQRLLGRRPDDPALDPVDEVRFSDGTRVHIVNPPLAPRGPVMTVKKAVSHVRSLQDLVGAGAMSGPMATCLNQAVDAGRSIYVAGPAHSGANDLLNALAALLPNGTRIVAVEQSSALRLNQHNVVYLEAGTGHQHQFDVRYLLRSVPRMSPERIIVTGLSGPEAYEWVCAAAAGTFGSMATGPGASAYDALGRIESLCVMGGPDLSPRGLREQIARAVHLVAVTERTADGNFRVRQLSEVQGIDLDAFRISDIFYHRSEGGGGTFAATGYVPSFYEALRAAGVAVDTGIFQT